MTLTSRAHTSTEPEVDIPLDLQVRKHAALARKLQSAAMTDFLAGRWNVLSTISTWLVRWNRRVHTREALEACSERTLADIGIPREHIALVAKGVDHNDPVAVSQYGWWPRLVQALQAMGSRPEQLRVQRELSAYSDRELNEIGVRRSDIGQIARTA